MVVLWLKFNKIEISSITYSTFETTKFEVEFSSRSIPESKAPDNGSLSRSLFKSDPLVFLWPLKEKKQTQKLAKKKIDMTSP